MSNKLKIKTKAGIMMKNKYSKGPYWKFKDHLSDESKNVVLYHLLTIMEEEYPKLLEEVEHLVDRNLVKDELIESISYLFKRKRKIAHTYTKDVDFCYDLFRFIRNTTFLWNRC